MAVNHILMQGSGCGSWELKPRCNLPAQLPFSNYGERCSGHFSKKLITKRRLPGGAARRTPLKATAVYRSNAGRWTCLNARPLMLHPLRINLSPAENKSIKAAKAIQSVKQEKFKGCMFWKCSRCKICSTCQLWTGFIIYFTVLKWLRMLSSVRVIVVWATCVWSIWKPEKHMFASAVSSQDQLSSVTNIC